jgi:hypothetical protein
MGGKPEPFDELRERKARSIRYLPQGHGTLNVARSQTARTGAVRSLLHGTHKRCEGDTEDCEETYQAQGDSVPEPSCALRRTKDTIQRR